MATTQYIGSRYVPILADPVEWSSAKTYEPLTIVTHEGNSYTSRQFVPHGIDITNNDYWALTGNYNAQIEQYRRETAQAVETSREYADEAVEQVNELLADAQNQFSAKPFAFENVAKMQAAYKLLYVGAMCHTNGFHESGDGGTAWYVISDTGTANGRDVIACGNLFANLIITKPNVTPEQFGAWGDGMHDDTTAIQAAVASGNSIKFSNKYSCGFISVSDIDGASYVGAKGALITGATAFRFSNCNNLTFDSLMFDACTNSNYALRFLDCDTVTVHNCKFSNMPYSAILLVRSTASTKSRRYIIDGCTFVNVNTSEIWGGGVYWDAQGSNGSDSIESKPIVDVTVTNCHFENVGCAGVNSGGCVGLTVCNNICDQNNKSYTATMGLLTASRESAKIVANDNIVLHTKFEGMIFNHSYDVIASNNYFEDCRQGIAVESTAQNCTFVGNSIVGGYADGLLNKDITTSYGILITNSNDIRINGNKIKDCYNGVYINHGTQDIEIAENEIITTGPCITGATSTATQQTKNVHVLNNTLISIESVGMLALMHSGVYVIDGNIITSYNYAAMNIMRPFDTSNFKFIITRNICKAETYAINLNDTSANQIDGVVHYHVVDNDFSECPTVIHKDASARILSFRYARNNHALTAAELFNAFDSNSVLKYAGTLADMMAETPGSQNMTYVRWAIGCVAECTDKFIHVTRAGNPGTGATLQYMEW